ncbi:hypothetical protein ACFU7T_10865 [Streptomyces sp. NPDC057555]|uniref:hypothetical protein n=1 Tax=Streptomyces sp. NPDC057555 TaxID=3346166 RepID=UPI0036AFC7EF
MKRRNFLAVAVAASTTQPRRIGASDVERLNRRFADIIASDHRHGGRLTVEHEAAALSDEALALQQSGIASQRVRSHLYASAAAFASSAMWAAIDGRRFTEAQRHFDRASSLAILSGNQAIQFRIWSHAGTLYRHMGRPAEGLAANDVARNLSATRRDPMFASLGHARHAALQGAAGDRAGVRRSLGHAQDALGRARDDMPRPLWLKAFYGPSELDSLGLTAHLALGNWEEAEARAHRSMAALLPHMHRSFAITAARLARAQLGQGDVEPAVNTAMHIPHDTAQHPRVAGMLNRFTADLHKAAPHSAHLRTWTQYQREART